MNLRDYLAQQQKLVDSELDRLVPPESAPPETIHRAMRYSLFAGGKRIRPILCMEAARTVSDSCEGVGAAACSLELIHTYSLIHDDLPALDNDDYRRGKLTAHKVFGEAMAILAGDALLTLAFEMLSKINAVGDDRKTRMIAELATAAGTVGGMIGGQVPTVGAAVEYGITKVTKPGAFQRDLPDDLKSGVRVVERNTTLDLTGWRWTSLRDLDTDRKLSRGLSLTSFVVQKTDPGAKYFVHTVSSDSKTAPSIWCDSHPFQIVEANSQAASNTRQWNVLVDISQEPDDRPFTVNLLVTFWNGFQKRDTWWSGFRVLHSTEVATYRVIFPPDLPASNIKFQYKDITSSQSVDLDPASLSTSPKPLNGQVSTLTWKVQNPQPDRSYRIYWSWPVLARPGGRNGLNATGPRPRPRPCGRRRTSRRAVAPPSAPLSRPHR
jgi:hypothetical protein